MITFKGKCAAGGIAVGKVYVYRKQKQYIKKVSVEDTAGELQRFTEAKAEAAGQLAELYDRAEAMLGKDGAAIFEVHRMLLEDEDFTQAVEGIITGQSVNAEYAVYSAADRICTAFAAMEDDFMGGRGADIKDVAERVLGILCGDQAEETAVTEPSIVVAEELSPSETVRLEHDNVLAFVTVGGSVTSHMAILARTMGIPALVGTKMKLSGIADGSLAAVDGSAGVFYVEPGAELLSDMGRKLDEEKRKKETLLSLKGKENRTVDGRTIELSANIGNIRDIGMALQNDAGGIGLFRSEFLYMGRKDCPGEEEQFQIYKTAVEAMEGRQVIIRTADLGTDKQPDCLELRKEENPALGCRGIRVYLEHPGIFRTQLRALLRAAAFGNLAILYPMIISVEEIRRIKAIVSDTREELRRQGLPYGNAAQGIMIETPAAVMISRELAETVDFFSIGTNDLTQYTLALDRQNAGLDAFYNPHHPAVLRMIQMTVENAHRAGIWAGVCGELAADTELTGLFLKMGVDELSVSPGSILAVRQKIRETDVQNSQGFPKTASSNTCCENIQKY